MHDFAVRGAPASLGYRHEENGRHFYDSVCNSHWRTPDADVDTCFTCRIAVTELRLF